MNILLLKKFVVDWHGTLTLCKRLALALQASGTHRPFLFKYTESELIKNILPEEQVLSMTKLKKGTNAVVDVMLCLTNEDLFYGCYLKNKFFPNAKLVFSIYHPRQMFYGTHLLPNFIELFNRKVAATIPVNNIYFMSEVCRETHERYYGRNFRGRNIIPVPYETSKAFANRASVNRNKVVSVGRLVDFKRYVFHVVSVLSELRRQGHELTYDVVGDGPLLPELREHISRLNAQSFVTLHGKMSPQAYKAIVKDAGLFIGMGTTVIESADAGIPTLVAIESNDTGQTYGYIHDLPDNALGDDDAALARFTYLEKLQEYLAFEDYETISKNSWRKAQFYDLDKILDELLAFCERADAGYTLPVNKLSVPKYLLAKVQNKFLLKKEFRHK